MNSAIENSIPNKTRSTAAFPRSARMEIIQMRIRRGTPDMMSSQGLKSSWVGVQMMEVELEQ